MNRPDLNDTYDPYQVLGITKGADKLTIKRAYRHLVKRCHPDLNPNKPGAESRFKQIQYAYDVIMQTDEMPGGMKPHGRYPEYGYHQDLHPFESFYWMCKLYLSKNKA
ncbi:MAG: hypothetical protein DRH90_07525 [Deltaproteobacteria bacterium]|nr:MAG: hypothetical protein DRH90_07525 [Deltaproteobacteria bacterium]RLC17239.1 MAG: hypothetical protein DRI24_06290 [Deltaproteobacteria bacterium]HHE73883.1 J domain-containing protein [Desulfobacteraceae bacterium]